MQNLGGKPIMGASQKPRRQMHRISDEMKIWSAMLAAEVTEWPGVTTKHFFGSTALYRKEVIFGAVPRTRGLNSSNSLIVKMASLTPRVLARLEKDVHIQETVMQNARWFSYEMEADGDLRGALEWLGEAYEGAGKKR